MYLLLLWEIYFLERGDFVLNTTCIMIYVYEMLSVTPSLCINVVFVIYWIKNIFNSHLSISFIVPASINKKKKKRTKNKHSLLHSIGFIGDTIVHVSCVHNVDNIIQYIIWIHFTLFTLDSREHYANIEIF